jgi:hypothetical protein
LAKSLEDLRTTQDRLVQTSDFPPTVRRGDAYRSAVLSLAGKANGYHTEISTPGCFGECRLKFDLEREEHWTVLWARAAVGCLPLALAWGASHVIGAAGFKRGRRDELCEGGGISFAPSRITKAPKPNQ